jgi:hypothetical protein
MSDTKITIKTGSIVEGADFYGREKELEYAWNLIQNEKALLLSAPRRVGKSSFAKKMLKTAEEKRWNTLDLDLESIETEEQFAKLFKEKLQATTWWRNLKSTIGDAVLKLIKSIGQVKYGGITISPNTAALKSDIYDTIQQLIEKSGTVLIVIDELVVFLNKLLHKDNGEARVKSFLDWLRSCRQISDSKARWIFCSSVGIENFTSIHHLSHTLNDVPSFPIGSFTESEARTFIPKLQVHENVKFTDEDIQYILDKLSWYLPFFIRIFIGKIDYLVKVEGMIFSKQTIDKAWQSLISENHFNSWDERLKEYYEYENEARKILDLCSAEGRSRNNLFEYLRPEITETNLAKLLYMLQNDGYLVPDDRQYTFRSSLLRDFWHKRFVQ